MLLNHLYVVYNCVFIQQISHTTKCDAWNGFLHLKILCYQMYYFWNVYQNDIKSLLYLFKTLRCLTKPFFILELNYAYTLIFLYMYWCYSLHLSFSFPHPWVVRVYKPTWSTSYITVNYHRDNLKISNITSITRNHTRVSSFMSLY